MLPQIHFLTTFLFIFPLAIKGLTVPLIPPTSPHSPFYTQILNANNISNYNATLNRTHYLEWLITKTTIRASSISINDVSEIYQLKTAGYHVTDVYIGNPVQLVYGIFDTGSDIIWFQCKDQALRKGKKFGYFNETKSDTYAVVKCGDKARCDRATSPIIQPCQGTDTACPFQITYQDQTSASGVMSTDVTTFKPDWWVLHDFIFGCSSDNSEKMLGVIGAGNSKYSLPNQLFVDPKFSYCIPSDLTKVGLVKFGTDDAQLTGENLPIHLHPKYPFYYMQVLSIQVNDRDLDVDKSVFEMSADGTKGFIIDSGMTVTYLTSVAFSALQNEIERLLGPAKPYLIFSICYPSSTFGKYWPRMGRPRISIKFSNITVFQFDEQRMWEKMNGSDLECLQVLRTMTQISVLGNDLLLDVNVGFDPKNELLFLQHTNCPLAQ